MDATTTLFLLAFGITTGSVICLFLLNRALIKENQLLKKKIAHLELSITIHGRDRD
jgi:hypothetical protein